MKRASKNLNKRTFLVTGGAGFIGSHIVDKLLDIGHSVVIVDNLSTGKKKNINSKSIFYKLDICNKRTLESVFKRHRIDYVIHQAAKINSGINHENAILDVNTSVLGTLNLLDFSVKYKIKKLIYASSVSVYGEPKKIPVAERDQLLPIYSYGVAKKCAEEYVRYYSHNHGLNYTILRYSNVYGPRQPIFGEVGVIAIYTDLTLKGKPLIIYGDGTHLRDYIYVDDAVNLTYKALTSADQGLINIACGKGVCTNEIFAIFNYYYNNKLKAIIKPERTGESGSFCANIKKSQKLLKCTPKVSIKEGIKKTIDYYSNKAAVRGTR